jgi:hypothetical protein
MSKSHYLHKADPKLIAALSNVEDKIKAMQPLRSMLLFKKPQDTLFNKFDKLPPQAHYTEDIAASLFTALEEGHNEAEACALAMIPNHIVRKWLILGKKGIEPFQEFQLRFERSIVLASKDSMDRFKQANPEEWAKWHLGKGRPSKHWKAETTHRIIQEEKKSVLTPLTQDERTAKIRELLTINSTVKVIEGKIVE